MLEMLAHPCPWSRCDATANNQSFFLTLLSPPLANLGRKTSFDGRNTSSRAARVASDEVQSVLPLIEFGVWRSASLAGNIFHCVTVSKFYVSITVDDGGLTDIPSQHVLNLFLLESTLDNQTPTAIDGTTGTQFSKEV